MLKSMRKSKNRYFYIFVSPVDAPGAITLNVVWMEGNSMLTNCLAACAHLSITVSEIQRDICEKIGILSYLLAFDAPPIGGGFPSEYRHPLWYGKTRMVSLPDGEKILKISLFILAQLRNVTDRQTDGRTDGRTPGDGNSRAMHSIAWQKLRLSKIGSYNTQMSHTHELTRVTPTQTLWNQSEHRSQPTHGTRADLFFPCGGSSALYAVQISSTCLSAGLATSPLDDVDEVDGCGNCGGGCNGWSSIS